MCGRYSALTEDEIIEIREILRNLTLGLAVDEFENAGDSSRESIHSDDQFGLPAENTTHDAFSVDGAQSSGLSTGVIRREVFPTNYSPVVTCNGDEFAMQNARFGFEKWDGKGVIINARAETVKDKSMFKGRIDKGRCVIPTSGYFEWKTQDTDSGEKGKKKKIKHLIKDKQGNLLFMAGLWREGLEGKEFVVITKEPVGSIVDIHNRMPVMLRTDQLESWLSGEMSIEELSGLEFECLGTPMEEPSYNNLHVDKDNGGEQQTNANDQISLF